MGEPLSVDEFDLREFIRQELDSSPVADPKIVAEHIAKLIPDSLVRVALGQALPRIVYDVSIGQRRHLRRTLSGESHPGRPVPLSRWAGPDGAGAIYTAWQKLLSQRETIGSDDSSDSWRFLGDMTGPEVLLAAKIRTANAIKNAQTAERYKALAALVPDGGTVRDIPMEQTLAVFS